MYFKPELNRVWVGNNEVVLTALELKLLRLLWLNRGSLLLYSEIIDVVWENDFPLADHHNVVALVRRLRKKIGRHEIQSRRGIGYGMMMD